MNLNPSRHPFHHGWVHPSRHADTGDQSPIISNVSVQIDEKQETRWSREGNQRTLSLKEGDVWMLNLYWLSDVTTGNHTGETSCQTVFAENIKQVVRRAQSGIDYVKSYFYIIERERERERFSRSPWGSPLWEKQWRENLFKFLSQ